MGVIGGESRAAHHKRVETRYPVMGELLSRWSPRSFSDTEPEVGKLRSMFEAARLAPSAHNSQPTRFFLGRRDANDVYGRLLASLDPHNQTWAHRAPVLILGAVARLRFSQATGEYHPYPHCMHDLGLAVMSLMIQAQNLGLYSHPMAAFDPDRAQQDLAIPPLYLPGIMIAVGYPGAPNTLEPDLRDRELARRTRRPLEDLVFDTQWGQAASILAT